ncbi:restriction endonuclease subunit S [Paracoccus shanxieyensis]|uniref:Restriction endonuclease n=1 Tax=Paracoccus shanxieyensis TaxID=2675752 RepID=A0A6L6IWJ3_9RHOB|nr:restriction endonuclease subunit S [Paracoccus shanxieyensis]MTH63642.1 restriction endonuclease [Paracoccus shanxieyensis]MTH86565.1 restriction endonuclease [Paracoccus shanxieyensis]
MNAERLLALYEQVAEAPDAVPRLRRFVLDLAVRGKLVPQEAGDEPASELLKRIAAEKARSVKAGEIRKPRDLANGDELVPPFDIPASWQWCRLDTVGAIIGGGTPSAGDSENFAEPGEGIPWVTPADLGGFRELFIERGSRDLTEKGFASSSATMMPAGTVLFTSRAPIGYVAIAANPISTNQGFKSIVPYVADCSRFITLAMQTFAPDIDAKAPGTTFKEVSGKIVAAVPFPLPPLTEQRRIVAKVEELMALLDRLEAARGAAQATRDRLTAASLARLIAPDAAPAEFPANARFALATLPALTTRPDQIKPLRQTILNLAVRGKLVEQDPTDKPASELLKQIGEAKGAAKGRKGARAKGVPAATESTDTEVPLGWEPVRLEEVAVSMRYGTSIKCDYDEKHAPVLRIPNVSSGQITLDDMKYGPLSEADREALSLEADDLLMIRSNGSLEIVGRPAVVPPEAAGMAFAGYLVRLQTLKEAINSRYVWLALNSSAVRDQIERPIRSAVGLKNVNLTEFGNLSFWLPPIAEQYRIVAKVDALMALCDRLEAALTTADTTRARLLEALLANALNPATMQEMEAAE